MNDKIRKLQAEIENEKLKILKCEHTFMKPFFNPETVMEGYGLVQDGAGSDPHWSFAGYAKKQKDRWTRVCKDCGFEQHTYEQKPIVSGFEPNFN